jgi:hypothetical protein
MIEAVYDMGGQRAVIHDSGVKLNLQLPWLFDKYEKHFQNNPAYLIVGECLIVHAESILEISPETNSLTMLSGHSIELKGNMGLGLLTKYKNWKKRQA